jgi:hypothetical protein
MLTGTWDEQISVNADGLFEFENPELSNGVLEYFKRRNEDIPLEEAEKIAAQPPPTRRVRRPVTLRHKRRIIFHKGTRKFRVSI